MVGHRTEADRRIRLAEGGETHRRDRLAQRLGGNRQRIHIRQFALIGRHARGGVALHMFDRAHAFAGCELDVLGCDVVLEIDKGFDAARIMRMRDGPQEAAMRINHAGELHLGCVALGKTGFGCGIKTGCKPILKGLRQCLGAFARARRALGLRRLARNENLTGLIKHKLTARLREQMHGGRPAAAHQNQIARDRIFTIRAELADQRRFNAQGTR